MRAIDRMYFDKYAVDPEGEDLILDLSTDGWNDDPDEREMKQPGFYDDDWLEVE